MQVRKSGESGESAGDVATPNRSRASRTCSKKLQERRFERRLQRSCTGWGACAATTTRAARAREIARADAAARRSGPGETITRSVRLRGRAETGAIGRHRAPFEDRFSAELRARCHRGRRSDRAPRLADPARSERRRGLRLRSGAGRALRSTAPMTARGRASRGTDATSYATPVVQSSWRVSDAPIGRRGPTSTSCSPEPVRRPRVTR